MAMGLLGYGYGYDCGAMAMAVESLAKDGVEVGNGYKDTVEVESFGDGSLTEDGAEVGSVDEDAAPGVGVGASGRLAQGLRRFRD